MQEKINFIITKLLSDEANGQEIKELKEWLAASPDNKEYFAQIENIYLGTEIIGNKDRFNPLYAYRQFLTNKKNRTRKTLKKLIPIAATFVITFGLSLLYYFLVDGKHQSIEEYTVIETNYGSKSTVHLPDGSIVILNANSKLEYPADYNAGNRLVKLTGEGYFDVIENPDSRFIVETSDIEIKVFGTVFNIKSYPNENYIRTTLVEGSIAIYKNKKEGNTKILQLEPNQTATLEKQSGGLSVNNRNIAERNVQKMTNDTTFIKHNSKGTINSINLDENINPEDYTSWKDNVLIFKNEKFESIATKLERQYGAKIYFTDTIAENYRFTGTFKEISIEQALNALQFASHFNYKIDENAIYISK